ncbi:MAG: B12-binding domain-containing radical SAM protein, partial [Candidatus Thorarchaeota archaeon]
MAKKIAFVEANPPNNRGEFTKFSNLDPYGLEILGAVAMREGFDVSIHQQNEMPNSEFFEEVIEDPSDVCAFSCMAYNYDQSIALAKQIKGKSPDVRVIFGGSQVSSHPKGLEQALSAGVVDFGIRGEADYSFRDLINNIDEPDLTIPGLVYMQEGKIKTNPNAERIRDLDELPFALRDEKILERTDVGKLMFPAISDQVSAGLIAYSRGCPFSCSYCDSRNIWGRNVVWRSPKNVVDEIQELNERYGTNTLFFSDLTFNANPKKVHELCDELIDRNLGVYWYVMARPATPDGNHPLFDRELLEKMYEAGCTKMALGFEGGATDEIQDRFRKKATTGILTDVVEQAHQVGMMVKGAIILGDPEYETNESVTKTLEALKRIKFDELRTSFLTAFPGSELYRQANQAGELLTDDLSRYTTDEPNLRCRNLSSEELTNARNFMTSEYYGS